MVRSLSLSLVRSRSLPFSLSLSAYVCVHAPVRLGKVVLHLSVNTEPTHPVHTNDGLKHTTRKTLKVSFKNCVHSYKSKHHTFLCNIAPAHTLTYIADIKGWMHVVSSNMDVDCDIQTMLNGFKRPNLCQDKIPPHHYTTSSSMNH